MDEDERQAVIAKQRAMREIPSELRDFLIEHTPNILDLRPALHRNIYPRLVVDI